MAPGIVFPLPAQPQVDGGTIATPVLSAITWSSHVEPRHAVKDRSRQSKAATERVTSPAQHPTGVEAVTPQPSWNKVIKPASFSPRVIFTGLRDLYRYRDLLVTLTIHRVKIRYKQSVLGIAWAILQPVLLMITYTVIFSIVAKMPHEGAAPYAVFVYAALLPWTFFSTSITTGSTSLASHSNLITKVYFPREILPLTYVLASLFDFLIASSVLAVLLAIYRVPVGIEAVMAVPLMCIAFLFSTAMTLFLSAFHVRFRDIGIAMALIIQLWMYATPVVYPLSVVPRRYIFLYSLNPMAGIVENFRQVVLGPGDINYTVLLPGLFVCLILLPVSYLYFKSAEATMADVI
jgi:lipopolysaccharide transport system permease protein